MKWLLTVMLILVAGGCGAYETRFYKDHITVTPKPGPQGPPGNPGATGPIGGIGETGSQGPTGSMGNPGQVGATGPAGQVGAAGQMGDVGPEGPVGAAGPQGLPGLDSPGVTVVQFCADDTSQFPEYGLVIGGSIYAVYWGSTPASGGAAQAFLARVVPGAYYSTGGNGCSFVVNADGSISP